ncbi:MAG: PHP domain-containing protein [Eubacteriales bacterium]|nr:PHP domain-containing protein [Eubacteriales bacterium]
MYTDYHVHTEFSDDSVYPLEDVIKDAIRMNMDEICIIGHMDLITRYDENGVYPFEIIC